MTGITEICPGCKTSHTGFAPRTEQHRAFWRCRKCGAHLVTLKRPNGEWFSDFLLNQDADMLDLSRKHGVVSWLLGVVKDQRQMVKIRNLLEDAAEHQELYLGLIAIEPEKP